MSKSEMFEPFVLAISKKELKENIEIFNNQNIYAEYNLYWYFVYEDRINGFTDSIGTNHYEELVLKKDGLVGLKYEQLH